MPTRSFTKKALIFASTRTIPSIGCPGARGHLKRRARKTSRFSFRSATPPATGATSWRTNRSKTKRSPQMLNRAFRAGQSGSRRTARCRSHLHAVRAGDDRQRRLADVGLADARTASRFSEAPISRPIPATAGPDFADVLEQPRRSLEEDRERIEESSANVARAACAHAPIRARRRAGELDRELFDQTLLRLSAVASIGNWGGFGSAPKFPRPAVLNYLLRYYHRK